MVTDAETMRIARWYGPADALAERGVHDLYRLVESYRLVSGPAFAVIGREIVQRLKKLPGWRSPWQWFSSTNVPYSWVLVSYHHRSQLCWEWSLWLSVGRRAGTSLNPRRWAYHGHGQTGVIIPWLARLSLHRQRSGWMLSGDGENLIRWVAAAQGMSPGTAETLQAARGEAGQPGPDRDAPVTPCSPEQNQ
jgi:hypothetical protein